MQNIVCPENANATRYTIVCRIDGQSFGIAETFAFFSYSEEVYVSQDNIFVTFGFTDLTQTDNTTVTEQKTQISCISYQNDSLVFKGSVTVSGSVKDRYSMNEHAGILRVATTLQRSVTVQSGGNAADGTVSNRSGKNAGVYCIRLSDFAITGALENFAPWGEEVTAARFDDQTAYICTAVMITFTDPVYIVDLSDPENIVYKDTGIIPGYSTTLYPFTDGTLLGIGYGDARGLKIELYRETETNVESVTKFELFCDFSESFKSYFIDADAGYIGLLVTDYSVYEARCYYLLLRFDGYNLVPALELPLNGAHARARATVIDGYLYAFCDGDFAVGAL